MHEHYPEGGSWRYLRFHRHKSWFGLFLAGSLLKVTTSTILGNGEDDLPRRPRRFGGHGVPAIVEENRRVGSVLVLDIAAKLDIMELGSQWGLVLVVPKTAGIPRPRRLWSSSGLGVGLAGEWGWNIELEAPNLELES